MAKFPGARKDSGYKVICMAPSVNKTQVGNAVVPIPYPVMIDLSNQTKVSKNVKFNGNEAFLFNSDSTKVTGDQAGKLGGIKSGTQGAKAEPIDKSSSVKVNKQWLIRCNDMFYMNSKNTIGRLICVPPPPQASISDDGEIEAPESEDNEAFENMWENAECILEEAQSFAQACAGESASSNTLSALMTPMEGQVQGVFGVIEASGGAVGAIVPPPNSDTEKPAVVVNKQGDAPSPEVWSNQSKGTDPSAAQVNGASEEMMSPSDSSAPKDGVGEGAGNG